MSPVRWHTPVIPAIGRLMEKDFCEFEASLMGFMGFMLSNRSTRSYVIVSPDFKTKENKKLRKEKV